jgi:hypothetical protein
MASLVFAWPAAPNRNGMKHRLKAILEETKLEHLMPLFADQAVKDDIINYLDDSDLEKLGINKLGDRKRLLLAFARPSEFTVDGTVLLEVREEICRAIRHLPTLGCLPSKSVNILCSSRNGSG